MSTANSASFLDAEGSWEQKLLIKEGPLLRLSEQDEITQLLPASEPYTKIIKPKPGMCVKTRSLGNDGKKVFMNVCTSDDVFAPSDISEEQLCNILSIETEEMSDFRIPMSIGEGHEETDKSGKSCTAYDIIINTEFFNKCQSSALFQNFLVMSALSALEDKFNLELEKKDFILLRNKIYLGTLKEQRVRSVVPLVREVNSITKTAISAASSEQEVSLVTEKPSDVQPVSIKRSESSLDDIDLKKKTHERLITPISTQNLKDDDNMQNKVKKITPNYILKSLELNLGVELSEVNESVNGLAAFIFLPGLLSGKDVSVLLGEDRLVIESDIHYLDVLLPFNVETNSADVHFIKQRQVIVIRALKMAS